MKVTKKSIKEIFDWIKNSKAIESTNPTTIKIEKAIDLVMLDNQESWKYMTQKEKIDDVYFFLNK